MRIRSGLWLAMLASAWLAASAGCGDRKADLPGAAVEPGEDQVEADEAGQDPADVVAKRNRDALEEARAALKADRIDRGRAATWVALLIGLMVGGFMIAALVHALLWSPRVATEKFEATPPPRPERRGQFEHEASWRPSADLDRPQSKPRQRKPVEDESRSIDDGEFPV